MSPKRRIYKFRGKRRRTSIALIIVTVLAVVGACAPESSHWSPHQNVKRNDVRWITF